MSKETSHGENTPKLIKLAHDKITRTKGKDYAPDVHELQKWIDEYLNVKKDDVSEKWSEKYKKSIDCNNPKGFSQRAHCQGRKKKINETEILKGGLADNKSLIQIAKKHNTKSNDHIDNIIQSLKKELKMGIKVEMEHTNDEGKAKEIAMDHLWENPSYYTNLKKSKVEEETNEQTTASSSGSFEAPLFGGTKQSVVKRKINTIHNSKLNEEEEEVTEVTSASSSGAYDVPFGGGGTKGRKNPLKIDGPDSIYKNRAVKDKNWPRYGGPGGVYVKVKEKCKKFPYCNQGDTGALEFIKEDEDIQSAVREVSKKYGIPRSEIENLILNEIREIFI